MTQPIEVGMSYKEYLAKLRAEQFGWDIEPVTAIDEDVATPVKEEEPEKPKKAVKPRKTKKEVEDEV